MEKGATNVPMPRKRKTFAGPYDSTRASSHSIGLTNASFKQPHPEISTGSGHHHRNNTHGVEPLYVFQIPPTHPQHFIKTNAIRVVQLSQFRGGTTFDDTPTTEWMPGPKTIPRARARERESYM